MIEFEFLNKEKLARFIDSPAFNHLKNIPISRHRAVAHIKNPSAADEDILLILAYSGEELAGYLGILPDHIHLPDGRIEKCGWLSCIWVNAAIRGQGLGDQLIRKALKKWDGKVLFTDYVPATKSIYDKTGAFGKALVKTGIRIYVRADLHHILPPKRAFFKSCKPVFKFSDALMNALLDTRFLFYKKKPPPYRFQYVNQIDRETADFISKFQEKALFKRSAEELNWMLRYIWILSAPAGDFDSRRYHFSSLDRSFDFYCLRVFDDQERLVAFLVFAKRNRQLKLPYCFLETTALPAVAAIINFHIAQWRVNTFTTFHPALVKHLENGRTPGLLKKKITRHYLLTRILEEKIFSPDFYIQDGDGDGAFT